jgi:hypothetical protein
MILPAIYITLHLLTVVLVFVRRNGMDELKRSLIKAHLILFLLILADIFIINVRGVWLDRLLVVAFLLIASVTFALHRRSLRRWQKLYFGFFFFYPIAAAATFLIDKIMFVVAASPLLVTLTVPDIKFSTKDYEVREIVGALAPVQLSLIEKRFATERCLGITNDGEVTNKDITGLNIISETKDTTFAMVTSGDRNYKVAFRK